MSVAWVEHTHHYRQGSLIICLLASAAGCSIPCLLADLATGTAFFQRTKEYTMSAMSDLHLTSAMSLVYGKAIDAGHDDVEAMNISRFPDNDVLTEFGITQDDIANYADFLVTDYDWDEFDGDTPSAVIDAQGLLFEAVDTDNLWADAFETDPPF